MKIKNGQTIVFLGDSITKANLGSNYITALDRLFAKHSINGDFQFVNAGRDGDMVDDLINRLESDVLTYNPDWVVTLVGINDVFYESILMAKLSMSSPLRKPSAQQHMVEHFRENYSSLIGELKVEVKNLVICTTTAVEGGMSQGIKEKLALINDTIRALADEKDCELVDLSLTFKDHLEELRKENPRKEFLLTADGVHLNKHGAHLVAERLFEFFTEA